MRFSTLLDAVRSVSFNTLHLAFTDRSRAREYLSHSMGQYYQLSGRGLPAKNPVNYVYEQGWAVRSPHDRVEMPVAIDTPGGTRLDEWFVLAAATRALQPSTIFEIGTFNGRATSVFVVNAPAAHVLSLDLPPADTAEPTLVAYLATDVDLVKQRLVGSFLAQLNLADRYQQVFADSLSFDPTPYRGQVELGFIDGAHALKYVRNDTEKMAEMMSDRGLVFWHDYGGRVAFRDLTTYLDRLAKSVSIYRVSNTSLAWCPAAELKKIIK